MKMSSDRSEFPEPSESEGMIKKTLTALVASLTSMLVFINLVSVPARYFRLSDMLGSFRYQYFWLFLLSTSFFALVKKKKWIALCLVGSICNGIIVVPLIYFPRSENNLSREDKTAPPVRVFMANVQRSNHEHRYLLEILRRLQPDVVGVLEVNELWARSLNSLNDIYPYRRIVTRSDNFGIGVMSRYPIKNPAVLNFADRPLPSLSLDIEVKEGRVLHILLTHPVPPISSRWFELRNRLLTEIAQYITAIEEKKDIVVIGDFNVTQFSPFYDDFIEASGLRNASDGYGFCPTWPSFLPIRIPLDHAFVEKDAIISDYEVMSNICSDHYPFYLVYHFSTVH